MRYFLLLGLVVFTACAPARVNREALSNASVLSAFAPDRGEGGVYKLGEQVKFNIVLNQAGYLTLISYEPKDKVVPFEVNVRLLAGKQVFPRPEDRQGNAQAAYLIVPPTGTNRVIALYTDIPLNGLPRGINDQAMLETKLRAALESSQVKTFDLLETSIEVTP